MPSTLSPPLAADFTELDAARLYAELVNTLEPEPFLARLAPAVTYRSQWVLEDLTSRDAVADLLRKRIASARRAAIPAMVVRLGAATRHPQEGRPLAILCRQDDHDEAQATVDFEVRGGCITAVSICELFVHKPAWLMDPDRHVYPLPQRAEAEPAPVAPPRRRPPDADPADIITTFADVSGDLHAPVSDAAIALCPRSTRGSFEVMLVPADHAPLRDLTHPDLPDVLEQARRRDVFLFAVSHPADADLIAVMTLPRPTQPWATLQHRDHRWYTHGNRPVYEYGIDFDVGCELRLFCTTGLIYGFAPIVARPRPAIALPVLQARYAEIAGTATAPLTIDDTDVATWSRFLESGSNAARIVFQKGGIERLPAGKSDRRVAELALEAWPEL